MKYKSKRGTTINIPDGMDPKQIAAIKADADSGYGTRAQQTANKYGKPAAPRVPKGEVPQQPPQYFGKNGMISDPNKVVAGLAPTPNMTDLTGDIQKSRQGTYDYLTRNFEANKTQDLELKKQELAERGIPYNPDTQYDPNTKDLYGKSIGAIDRSYQDQYAQASNQANSSSLGQGTQAFNASVGAAGQQNNDFLQAVLGMDDETLKKYGIDKAAVTSKYGIDQTTAIERAKIALAGRRKNTNANTGGFEIVS